MRILLPTIFFILTISCNRPERVSSTVNPETPKALQENRMLEDIEEISKRGQDDLVDNLYLELTTKRADLKEMEKDIALKKEDQVEAVHAFETYNSKSNEYYNSANNHLAYVSDPALKEKLLALINESSKKYQVKSATINALVDQIKNQRLTINEYREVIKVLVTIPMIEKFQNDNLPNDTSYRRISREQRSLIGNMGKKIQNPE